MNYFYLIFAIALCSLHGYSVGQKHSKKLVNGDIKSLNSLPSHYGSYVALWCALPSLLILLVWSGLEPFVVKSIILSDIGKNIPDMSENDISLIMNEVRNLADGNLSRDTADPFKVQAAEHYGELLKIGFLSLTSIIAAVAFLCLNFAKKTLSPTMAARKKVEKALTIFMVLCSIVAILTTLGIVLSVLFEALRFFGKVGITDFLFGLKWSPQMAIRKDQVGATGSFGIIPLFTGTLLISSIAMAIAVPIGLLSAIYLSEYAANPVRTIVKPLLEILAGIPTVVYGFFAALTVAPFLRELGSDFGTEISSESALAAGLVMGVMIIPFVSSLSDDVINAVPQSLRDASLGIGATQSETIIHVILPAALPGIVSSVLLAVSRAIGETMIVVMAAGLTANLTANPFQAVTTMTVQIVTLLVGDQEFDSAKTLAAFAIGLVLFLLTLCLNIIALYVVRRYREQYE